MPLPAPTLGSVVPEPLRRLFRRVFPHQPPDHPALWRRACQKMVLGGVEPAGEHLVVHGWLVAPDDVRPHVEFALQDGHTGTAYPVTRCDYPLPRPDVAARLGRHVPAAGTSGFMIWSPRPDPSAPPGDLKISATDRRTGAPLGADYLPLFHPSADRLGPVPVGQHIRRVIGEQSVFSFAHGGYTAFRRMEAVVRDATGRPLSAYPRVLDWGCGCGRVSRYFLPLPGISVTGADVDPETVAWCRTNLPAGRWEVLPLRPPTALPDAGFDLAFGVSVFTHLKEPEQHAWLAELRRVIRPGGLALMTFHGDASVVWAGLSAERYTVLMRDGICDQPNPLYDADLGEADYYRDTFHTAGYVRRVWGEYFDVLDIRPSHIAHQDLAVLRRR
ncbi:MAG: class I SAM-dependent methyltransferase [Gemmataceae bacterium]